ncbi:mucin-2 [Megalops cyprinoides]|uniref:mucin-2 n=1 Tax=Megalops cyprinoides TaxID=118141 RepID=UPI0018646074|nr:mucin-2 [Megalops cyprinoides]
MEIKVNLVLCALVFLICSAHLRAQDTAESPTSNPALHTTKGVANTTPIPQTMTVRTSLVPESAAENTTVTNSSLNPSSILDTPLTGGPTINHSNSSTNDTAGTFPVSTLQPLPLNTTVSSSPQTTEHPGTTANVTYSSLANSTILEEPTHSPGGNIRSTTQSLNTDGPPPVSSTPHATVPHSSTHPPTPPSSTPTHLTSTITTTTTTNLQTSITAPAKPDTPSELNVGDDDVQPSVHNSGTALDPLLAGLVSVFIVSAAVISLLLFLKFRQRYERPEFRRLQDLPMDDMMEDTPLSMYSY